MQTQLLNPNPTTQDYLAAGLGYGVGPKSKEKYQAMLEQQERETRVIEKTRMLIEWAHTSYEKAKTSNARNLKVYTELILDWNPCRVFSTYRNFAKLAQYLGKDHVWRRLNRNERRFFAEAYEYYLAHSMD